MKLRTLIALSIFAVCFSSADAALVGFLGSVDQGRPGPVLGSLPRNFTLTLDYTPTTGGSTTINSATLAFPATPNPNTTNTNVEASALVMLDTSVGGITVANNLGPGGEDFFRFVGRVAAGGLGPNNVDFSFTFLNPSDTITNNDVNPTNIATLLTGQTSIAFSGGAGGFSGSGMIRGAPEPSSMIALCGLVIGGCGVGYRRRLKAKKNKTSA